MCVSVCVFAEGCSCSRLRVVALTCDVRRRHLSLNNHRAPYLPFFAFGSMLPTTTRTSLSNSSARA